MPKTKGLKMTFGGYRKVVQEHSRPLSDAEKYLQEVRNGPGPVSSLDRQRTRKAVEARIADFTAAESGGSTTNILINCRDDY